MVTLRVSQPAPAHSWALISFGTYRKLVNPFGDFGSTEANLLRDMVVEATYNQFSDAVAERPSDSIRDIFDKTSTLCDFNADERDAGFTTDVNYNRYRHWYFDFYDQWSRLGLISKEFVSQVKQFVMNQVPEYSTALLSVEAMEDADDEASSIWHERLSDTPVLVEDIQTFSKAQRDSWLNYLETTHVKASLKGIKARISQAYNRRVKKLIGPSVKADEKTSPSPPKTPPIETE